MSETRFFADGETPRHTQADWYRDIERAPHLDQPAHRPRLLKAAEFVMAAAMLGATTISDLGAGDGGLLSLVCDAGFTGSAWGYDLIDENVVAAQCERQVEVELGNFETDDFVEFGELVTLTEVLEHLIDPHGVLQNLPEVTRFVVASSPDNETWESRYIYHCWGWTMEGYRAMFEGAGWTVVRHERIPGFQVLLASR
jgi:2-polyprenyl-3-methyl-5-hydroxy-6-metoxy-1,4-benzoquinol methylase